ncbi:MAG: HPr kinase/phosphatase C-terminal domain-containing protein [Alphaproteobacteria bacterium]|nr:HPr kinase/phosphatase C-terminal domain-containing protein [Alphaproteobacteria bacterium]
MPSDIHASCVALKSQGILLLGASGAGKSDLALRLIMNYGAQLVADDRVSLISNAAGALFAACPSAIAGLLEARGVGIIKMPYRKRAKIKLAVKLISHPPERLPLPQFYTFEGVKIPQIELNPFEESAAAKIVAALKFAVMI